MSTKWSVDQPAERKGKVECCRCFGLGFGERSLEFRAEAYSNASSFAFFCPYFSTASTIRHSTHFLHSGQFGMETTETRHFVAIETLDSVLPTFPFLTILSAIRFALRGQAKLPPSLPDAGPSTPPR